MKRPDILHRRPTHPFPAARLRRGFTLIELIVYVAITAMVVVALTHVMLAILATRQHVGAAGEIEYALRLSTERFLERSLRADGVNVDTSTFDDPRGVLSLRLPVAAENPTVFALSGGRVQITQGTQSPSYLTSDRVRIDQLTFHRTASAGSGALLRITLTGHELTITPGEPAPAPLTLTTAVLLRP